MSVFENFIRLQVQKTEPHGSMPHDAFQMPTAAAAAVLFARIERDHHVATFPDAFVRRVDAEADAVPEGPYADQPVELPARGRQARGNYIGIVEDVNRSVQARLAQGA